MSTYFIVRLRTPTAPEGLDAAHAQDQLALSTRGRPCGPERTARLESAELAEALAEASREPIQARCGADSQLLIEQRKDAADDAAEHVARDSDIVREWLATLPPRAAAAAAEG